MLPNWLLFCVWLICARECNILVEWSGTVPTRDLIHFYLQIHGAAFNLALGVSKENFQSVDCLYLVKPCTRCLRRELIFSLLTILVG